MSYVPLLFGLVFMIAGLAAMTYLPRPAWIFAPILVALLAVAAVRYPGFVLAAYLYIPFYKSALEGRVPVDVTPLLAALCLVLAIPLFTDMKEAFPIVAVSLWAALLGIVVLGTMHAASTDLAATNLLHFMFLVFLPGFLAMRVARESRLLDQFLLATMVLSILVTVVGLIQLAGLSPAARLEPISNTIGTARSALFLPLIATVVAQSSKVGRFGILFVPFAVLVAVASGSRGPLLMAVLVIVVVNVLTWQNVGRKALTAVATVLVLVAAFQISQVQQILPQQSLARIELLVSSALGSSTLDRSSMARVHLFEVAAQMFASRPWLGHGTAGFESVARMLPGMEKHTYPHNVLFQVSAEFGVLGLLVTLTLFVTALLTGIRRIREPRVRAAFSLGLFALLNAMVSSGFYENRWLWGMLLMLIALPKLPDQSWTTRLRTPKDG